MPPTRRNVKTVSQLTREIKDLVEGNIGVEWVAGEVSNCRPARSGHVYFTLKDEHSQIAAVMWRSTAQRVRFELRDGMEVIAAGPVEVYAARGNYQLIVKQLLPQGEGALETALRQLREKLAKEGLFAPERKRELPSIPNRIALITSPHGAAVRDMLQVLTRRWPSASVVVVPVDVQGVAAAPQIAKALRNVHRIPGVDVCITGRGGGSLEDLWAFNEEIVARAIFECRVPVVSAVGHEIDVSIADLVADRRALTPSEAGELVVPNHEEFAAGLSSLSRRLVQALGQRATMSRMQLDALASRRVFTNPLQRVHEHTEHVDDLSERLVGSLRQGIERYRQTLAHASDSLHALSPLSVLARGYSMTFRAASGDSNAARVQRSDLIRESRQLQPDDLLVTYLERGRVVSRVEHVENGTGDEEGRESEPEV